MGEWQVENWNTTWYRLASYSLPKLHTPSPSFGFSVRHATLSNSTRAVNISAYLVPPGLCIEVRRVDATEHRGRLSYSQWGGLGGIWFEGFAQSREGNHNSSLSPKTVRRIFHGFLATCTAPAG